MNKEPSDIRTNNTMLNISKTGLVRILMLTQSIANEIGIRLKILQIFNTKW